MRINKLNSILSLTVIGIVFVCFAVQAFAAVSWNWWIDWNNEFTCNYARAGVSFSNNANELNYVYNYVETNISGSLTSRAVRYYYEGIGSTYGEWLDVEYPSETLPLANSYSHGIVYKNN